MTKLCFTDVETTGLDPDRHEIWEVGLIVREENGDEHEHKWFLPVDLGRADPAALRIGGFHDRWGRDDRSDQMGTTGPLGELAGEPGRIRGLSSPLGKVALGRPMAAPRRTSYASC